MVELSQPEKCRQTLLLTKDIIKKNMSSLRVKSLHSEIYNNEMQEVYISPLLTIQNDNDLRCKQIAEHYLLLSNIFYMIKKAFILNDDNPTTSEKKANVCTNRLERMKLTESDTDVINISKNVCKDKNTPELTELNSLYGFKYKFSSISDKQKEEYDKMQESITKSKAAINKYENIFDETQFLVDNDHSLAKEYNVIITNIKNNIMFAQVELMRIFYEIFYYDETTKKIHIREGINADKLEELAKRTLDTVTKMYLTCENEFYKSVEFQEKINELKKNQEVLYSNF